jgi:hypothetical protein
MIVILLLGISACAPVSQPDPGGGDDVADTEPKKTALPGQGEDTEISDSQETDLAEDGQDAELTVKQKSDLAEEGEASVHYHYTMNNPDLEFKIEPVMVKCEAGKIQPWLGPAATKGPPREGPINNFLCGLCVSALHQSLYQSSSPTQKRINLLYCNY